jgi:hypothetical protein
LSTAGRRVAFYERKVVKVFKGCSSFSCKIWRFALKNCDFSMICKIELGATGVETESLAGRGSPGDDRQILHGKDDYP